MDRHKHENKEKRQPINSCSLSFLLNERKYLLKSQKFRRKQKEEIKITLASCGKMARERLKMLRGSHDKKNTTLALIRSRLVFSLRSIFLNSFIKNMLNSMFSVKINVFLNKFLKIYCMCPIRVIFIY